MRRSTAAWLILAALVALAQCASAFFVHVAARAEPTRTGWAVPPTRTYLQAFALSEVILTAVSLAAIVVVFAVLRRRTMHWLAWGVAVGATALGLIGFVSLLGAGACLLLACLTASRRRPTATRGASGAASPPPLQAAAATS